MSLAALILAVLSLIMVMMMFVLVLGVAFQIKDVNERLDGLYGEMIDDGIEGLQ